MSYSKLTRGLLYDQTRNMYVRFRAEEFQPAIESYIDNLKTSKYMVERFWRTEPDVRESYQRDRLQFPLNAEKARNEVYSEIGCSYIQKAKLHGKSLMSIEDQYFQREAVLLYEILIADWEMFTIEAQWWKNYQAGCNSRRRGRA
jgi:hypothetical protein